MGKTSIIATAISETRGIMSDEEFGDALKLFTNGEYAPVPNTLQKYRTGQREPNYKDLQIIFSFGAKYNPLSLLTQNELSKLFGVTTKTKIAEIEEDRSSISSMRRANCLRIAREAVGLKQNEVATKLNIRNVNLCRYENGSRVPDIETLINLSKLYDVTIDQLISVKDSEDAKIVENDNLISTATNQIEDDIRLFVNIQRLSVGDKGLLKTMVKDMLKRENERHLI